MKKIIVVPLILLSQFIFAQDSLCKSDEEVLFSCNIGKKTASVCRSQSKKNAYYIFGTKNSIELKHTASSNKQFLYTQHFDTSKTRVLG